MTKNEIEIANIYAKLDELKEKCLLLHSDSVVYQMCNVIKEVLDYIVKMEHKSISK